jgi:hypothetical protein
MVKLFKAENRFEDKWWCFAPDEKTAQKIIKKEVFQGRRIKLNFREVTSEHLCEDGVKYLIDHNFVGIPDRAIFMLNGCMSAMEEHYTNKKRSDILWYSKKVPGSRELWQK